MPWDPDRTLASQRADFIEAVEEGARPFLRICADFGISRKTGYKWLGRARLPEPHPLRDRSRRPCCCPGRVPEPAELRILAARDEYRWGARKLHAFLTGRQGEGDVPCRATIHKILQRAGRVRPPVPPVRPQRFERRVPNHLWQIDYKGPLPCPGRARYLLSIEDDHSRYLLAARLTADMTMATAWALLWEVFGEAGLPLAILSDNGFAPRGPGGHGLSWLETRLERLGVLYPHGRPRHPQTQGKVERYHRTIGEGLLGGMDWGAPDEGMQRRVDAWREVYNRVRPHEGAENGVPAEKWWPSERPRPPALPRMAYPPGSAVRRVQGRGEISWRGYEITVGMGMEGEPVRVAEDDGMVEIHYGRRRLRALPAASLAKGRFN
jgi:transposase InsO family protein